MDCEKFAGRLEAYSGPEGDRLPVPDHVADCAECRLRLDRARALADTLRSLDREPFPAELDESVRAAARAPRPVLPPSFLRAAAAILIAVGVAFAFGSFLFPGPGYQPLDLKFVQEPANGNGDEEFVLEEIYGPQTPLLAANGGAVGGG